MRAPACSLGISGKAITATNRLDGLNLLGLGAFEGNVWTDEAKVRMGLFIDERTDEKQRQALQTIFGGQAGGWPAIFATKIGEFRGVEFVPITFEVADDLACWRAEIPGRVVGRAQALSGPTTPAGKRVQTINPPGSEVGPGHVATWANRSNCGPTGSALSGPVRTGPANTFRSIGQDLLPLNFRDGSLVSKKAPDDISRFDLAAPQVPVGACAARSVGIACRADGCRLGTDAHQAVSTSAPARVYNFGEAKKEPALTPHRMRLKG